MKPKPTSPPMAEPLVPDDIWDAFAPLLPTDPVDRAGCAAGHLADAEMQGDPAALKFDLVDLALEVLLS